MKTTSKIAQRTRRHLRIRAKVVGTGLRPRLAVFKSHTAVYAQLIDDAQGITLAAASTQKIVGDTMRDKAHSVGKLIATIAKEKGVEKAVFDRGGFLYAGLVKAVAEGAREGGIAM